MNYLKNTLMDLNKMNEFFSELERLKNVKIEDIPMEDQINMILLMGKTNKDEELIKMRNSLINRKNNLNKLLGED